MNGFGAGFARCLIARRMWDLSCLNFGIDLARAKIHVQFISRKRRDVVRLEFVTLCEDFAPGTLAKPGYRRAACCGVSMKIDATKLNQISR